MKYLFLFILIFLSIGSFAQNHTLRAEKGRFYIDDQKSTLRDFVNVMESNPEAYELALKAKSGYGAGSAISFIGGFLIGWPLGTALGGGDPNWGLAAAGAGVLVVAIPIMSSANKKLTQAMDIYNNGSSQQMGKLDLKIMSTKVGLVYSF